MTYKILINVSAFVIYSAVTVLYFSKGASITGKYIGEGTDPLSFLWFLRWWPFAVMHHLNPFYSNYIWFPHGQNLAWLTSVPFAALLALPLTLTLGPAAAFNILSVTAPILAAFTCFLLARRISGNWLASIFSGYFFGFSSYELSELLGHLNLDMIFLIPLAILFGIWRLYGEVSGKTFISLLCLVLVCQFGISTEIFATFVVFSTVSWCVFFVMSARHQRVLLWRLARECIIAIILTVVLLAPFEYFIFSGISDTQMDGLPLNFQSADPFNYLFQFAVSNTEKFIYTPFAIRDTTDGAERGAYLGLPLVLILILYFTSRSSIPNVRALLIVLLIFAIASLGPVLHLNGVATKTRLPWMIASRLPLISSALPVRFSMYVSLASAIAVALWLSDSASRYVQVTKYLFALVAIYFIAPNLSDIRWKPLPLQPFFDSKNIVKVLGKDRPNVIIFPFSYTGAGMAWQLQSNMEFTQTGGYAGAPPRAESMSPLIAPIGPGFAANDFPNKFFALCDTHHVNYILLAPGTPNYIKTEVEKLAWPETLDHGVYVIRVPAVSQLRYASISGDFWPDTKNSGWIGRQVGFAIRGMPSHLILTGGPREVHIKITGLTDTANFDISANAKQEIDLPAVANITLETKDVFVPNRIFHNGDRRRLSLKIEWKFNENQ